MPPPSPLRFFNHFLLNQSDISWPGIPVTLFTLWSAIGWGRQGNLRERENILSQKNNKEIRCRLFRLVLWKWTWGSTTLTECQLCGHTQFYFFCVIVETFFFFQNGSEGKIDLIPENICWNFQFNNKWIFVPNLQSWSWNSALSAAK